VIRPAALTGLLVWLAMAGPAVAREPGVSWQPAIPGPGDVAMIHVETGRAGATVEGSLDAQPLAFFATGAGHAALAGIDLDARPGPRPWRLSVLAAGEPPRIVRGTLMLGAREFPVQRLTLPRPMVDLDPATERRALGEGERLRALYRITTPIRLWQGPFQRPVPGSEPGTGFGARRVINGQPRAAHSGIDYAAPAGTPVVAANRGRVALVADFFFPGRLVVLDHGLGLYTLYFHLDTISASEGQTIERGQPIGTVGATGRATGPHLHFGVQLGAARVDPTSLLSLVALD
jgi:murein DD-endopeptidase MepM/ murein hydrolase activator NlpD